MKNISKYMGLAVAALSLAACQEIVLDNQDSKDLFESSKEITIANGYAHGDVYGTDGVSYKNTVILLTKGMSINYDGIKLNGYTGTGYALDIAFNSSDPEGLTPGVYSPAGVDEEGKAQHFPFTYDASRSTLEYFCGAATTMDLNDATIEVSKNESGQYGIIVTSNTSSGVRVRLEYNGAIEFADVFYYLEPQEAKTVNVSLESVSVEPYAGNYSQYCQYYGAFGGPFSVESFDIAATGSERESLALYIDVYVEKYYPNLPSGTYSVADGTLYDGRYGIYKYNSNTGTYVYSTSGNYRTAGASDSYLITKGGEVYYVVDGSVDIVMDGDNVKSFEFEAESAYGSTLVCKYVAK